MSDEGGVLDGAGRGRPHADEAQVFFRPGGENPTQGQARDFVLLRNLGVTAKDAARISGYEEEEAE